MAKKAKKSQVKKKAVTTEGVGSVKPSETKEVISAGKLNVLLKSCRSAKKDADSINGTIREKIGYAKGHDHLHTGAFSLIRRLDRMEPEDLANFMDAFDHMYDTSGLAQRAESALRMNFGPGEDKVAVEGDAAEAEQEPTTVRAFPQQRSVAAE